MNNLEALAEQAGDETIAFAGVDTIVELFAAPIPNSINDSTAIEGVNDLVGTSHLFGAMSPLFLPSDSVIFANVGAIDHEISATDFLCFQLARVTTETLYHLINKTDADVTQILDFDTEYAADESYDPEGWLNWYQGEFELGLKYLSRLKAEAPDEMLSVLADACLDESAGLKQWLEEDISMDFSNKARYDNWECPIAVVFQGDFSPYWSSLDSQGLACDSLYVEQAFVRNYDEG